MDGILLVDKPEDWTSHDVVAKVRGLLKTQAGQNVKVGHTGTLDPMATGLLVLVVGSYTKKAQQFSKLDKTYEAEVTLCFNSSTGDREGQLTKISAQKPNLEDIQAVLNKFVGKIMQTPPGHSAIKVGGKRAYQLAREGKTVELEAREVTIYSIDKVNYKYPQLSFLTSVSSGTYVRSLAEDIGKELGTGGYLSNLRRTSVGEFNISEGIEVSDITSSNVRSA